MRPSEFTPTSLVVAVQWDLCSNSYSVCVYLTCAHPLCFMSRPIVKLDVLLCVPFADVSRGVCSVLSRPAMCVSCCPMCLVMCRPILRYFTNVPSLLPWQQLPWQAHLPSWYRTLLPPPPSQVSHIPPSPPHSQPHPDTQLAPPTITCTRNNEKVGALPHLQ